MPNNNIHTDNSPPKRMPKTKILVPSDEHNPKRIANEDLDIRPHEDALGGDVFRRRTAEEEKKEWRATFDIASYRVTWCPEEKRTRLELKIKNDVCMRNVAEFSGSTKKWQYIAAIYFMNKDYLLRFSHDWELETGDKHHVCSENAKQDRDSVRHDDGH